MSYKVLQKLNQNDKYLSRYYKKLVRHTKQARSVGSINEWIIDNYYVISEQMSSLKSDLQAESIARIKTSRKNYIDELMSTFLNDQNFKINFDSFCDYMNTYQLKNKDYFNYDEVDYINLNLRLLVIDKLKNLVHKLNNRFEDKLRIEALFKNIETSKDLEMYVKIDESILTNHFYIEELNYKLTALGLMSGETFKRLNELLIANNLSLKEIIRKQQEEMTLDNLLMVNLFGSLKNVSKYKIETLYENISFSEKALIGEKVGVYDQMFESSKYEYRTKIKKNIRKSKLKEYDYVRRIVEQADDSDKHVGYILFGKVNYKLRSYLYITMIAVLTIALSLLGASYIGFIGFFLLLIPVAGFVVDVTTQIILKLMTPKSLFKIKLEDGLEPENATMVVIPTIIKDEKRIAAMFDNLELYYLSNKTDNIYFTLLGDVASASKKTTSYDEKIAEYGLKCALALNKKHGKQIFYFVYRNRFFSESEQCFLGYERKRGALIQFNKLLLGKFSLEEEKKWFYTHSFGSAKPFIKYVITLDADTKLLLNTALKLVGTMIHPMNRPVLADDKKSVKDGYAIMQPRISIDVEVTNKSKFSQLFAGLGGLDIYVTKTFDLYQDVFNEGSFTGKGIYDLAVFDEVLADAFPENLILSHDLLEGSYLRAGFISDLELFDGYPSKYLNDAMRHHRWTRGDWQIISWLKNKVRQVNNPISVIAKWKIFDNLRRSLTMPSLLLLIVYGFTLSKVGPTVTILIALFIIATPIWFYLLNQLLSRQKYDIFLKYYLALIRGFLAVISKVFIMLAVLPYEAYLYLDAIIKALYRMYVSKHNLLNWITSDEVEATSKNDVKTYVKAFKVNYVAAFLLVVLTIYFKLEYRYLGYFIALMWVVAPFIMYKISCDIVDDDVYLNEQIEETTMSIAKKTWKFFNDLLTSEYNYLMPDNYQLNRANKVDLRTSPTNIGFSLVSVISAYELKLVGEKQAIDKLANIINSVEKLNKWHGHLYNWYNIAEMQEIQPYFISTADSGNFVACLYVVKGFLDKKGKYDDLKDRVIKLIDNTDFAVLYNKEQDVFSIGYTVNEGSLVPFHYNNFLSESRLASFIAILKGDVPYKHWFCLDKTLTKHKYYKGVVSWTGTMFEYYMPLIFMKTYKHTLLDETYLFAYYAQREFINQANSNLPWGITESAYNELDDAQNYKYKAFGVPYLKFNNSDNPPIVVAPYGSLMAITKQPLAVYNNIKKFQALGMEGDYGLFESYDHDDKAIIKAYYSHHQGMILSSIANYFTDNAIQEYFHRDKHVQAVEILLKEKVQIKPYIDLKITKYKKYSYQRDIQDSDIRQQDGIMPIPEVGILSNGFYTTFINDRGVGFSKYKNLNIFRYRKITDENHGLFIYLKNLNNNKVWTNTYYPSKTTPDNYRVVFATDRIKYIREDDNIITNTEITVTKDHNAEIRKITIENMGDKEVHLELTSYGEIIMSRNEEDIAHRAFNSMTINAYVDDNTSSIIYKRKSKTKEDTNYYVVHRFFGQDDDDKFEYETSRLDFMGRNNTTSNPDKVINSIPLASNASALIDPIMSIRKYVTLKPNNKKVLYALVGFGKSEEQVMEIVHSYDDDKKIYTAFETATFLNNMRNHYANLNGRQLASYNTMLKHIYQTSPTTNERKDRLKVNQLSQADLWKFGVSGDLPIILVTINDVEHLGFLKEALQAYEFCKSRAIYVDVVIVNKAEAEKGKLIKKYIDNLMYRINNLNYFENSLGNVYTIDDITPEEHNLFKLVSKIYLDASSDKTFDAQIWELNFRKTLKLDYNHNHNHKFNSLKNKSTVYGDFISDGREYQIDTPNTPMPWSNVLANEHFGTVITNNLGGYTYAHNSREFKITSWSNDSTSDPASEALYINGSKFVPYQTVHGFGYTTFIGKTKEYDLEITVFVPVSDNVKVYDIKVINLNKTDLNLEIMFEIKPVLGVNEEQTNRYILADFNNVDNTLYIENTYNAKFRNQKVFVTSTEQVISYDIDDVVTKSITVSLGVKGEHHFAYILGCSTEPHVLIDKYNNVETINRELELVKEFWLNKLSAVQVKTPDSSFDNVMNGWYLYQTYASRLFAKAAFYQTGGATGFRDQLQDVMSVLYTEPARARSQILYHAAHQFKEGDVLHWWHEELMFGARTNFSDDYLWLVYVTDQYLEVTKDYSILEELVPFVLGDRLNNDEHEKGINYSYSEDKASLYEHLKLSVERSLSRMGKHQLPLMGNGDWNDGMNRVGHKGFGESVWVGLFLYDVLGKMINLATKMRDESKELYTDKQIALKETLNEKAWDGKWYMRAYFDDGTKLGSHTNVEGKIDIIAQSWSILTGVVSNDKVDALIEQVDQHLVDEEAGIIKLITPSFTKNAENPGYIADYLPGLRENGGQYTHGVLWYIMALIKSGQADKAYKYYAMISPVNHSLDKEAADIYKVEPYVIAADIYSNPNHLGRGGWTWYTGSASWAYKIGLENFLGFKLSGNTLKIEPNINSKWRSYQISYRYLDTTYNIEVNNPNFVSSGVSEIIHNQQLVEVIELVNDKKEHNVTVKMGDKNDNL